MTALRCCILSIGLTAAFVWQGASAAYLDFTDNGTISSLSSVSNGYEGSIDGIGFTLTSTNGQVNFNEAYDGSAAAGCQSGGGPLKCDRDGTGIGNDEITGLSTSSGQTLSLVFDSSVYISGLDFLDLYKNRYPSRGGEQVRVTVDGATTFTVDAIATSGDGGYASLDLLSLGGPIIGQTLEFTAYLGALLQDDKNNDYAFAGVEVSAVPVPAAAWLFGSALVVFVGMSRRRKIG